MHIGRHNSEQKYYFMRGQLLESVKEEKDFFGEYGCPATWKFHSNALKPVVRLTVVVVFNYLLVTQCYTEDSFVNNGLADKTSTEPGLGLQNVRTN